MKALQARKEDSVEDSKTIDQPQMKESSVEAEMDLQNNNEEKKTADNFEETNSKCSVEKDRRGSSIGVSDNTKRERQEADTTDDHEDNDRLILAKVHQKTDKVTDSHFKPSTPTSVKAEEHKKAESDSPTPQQDPPKENDSNETQRKKSQGKKYGFRLTPDEQELAYELKASMMRKLDDRNTNLEAEQSVQRSMQSVRRQQQQKAYGLRTGSASSLSQHNMKLLMKTYEKKCKESEDRIKQLEKEVKESQDLARRYHDMYLRERDRSNSTAQPSARSTRKGAPKSESPSHSRSNSCCSNSKTPRNSEDSHNKSSEHSLSKEGQMNLSASSKNSSQNRTTSSMEEGSKEEKPEKVTDKDLDDDEAVYKRHVAKLSGRQNKRTTSPIRIQDIIRKNEVLIQENEELRREVGRLKWDNGQLIKKVKLSSSDQNKLLCEISTSESARRDLGKRLEKEQKEKQKLGRSLTRQTADWILFRKHLHQMEEQKRLHMLTPVMANEDGAEERMYVHSTKKNVYMPRKMLPVDQWAQANKTF